MTTVLSLDGQWLLAPDPRNEGREQQWWAGPRPGAKPTPVPWIIQGPFPGYHGVAWYWKEFGCPPHPDPLGRYLLRFWAVDYLAEVWLNDEHVGGHEGGETPFLLDVTAHLRPGESNRLAVRVLNPTHDPIDGIVLNETPHRNKALPYSAGSAWNQGGIMDSVELLITPPVRVADLFVRPELRTGALRVQATLSNALPDQTAASLQLVVAPAAGGETLAAAEMQCDLPTGETVVETELRLEQPRMWELNDPFLYRVTARVGRTSCRAKPAERGTGDTSFRCEDEVSIRCGFRDFRFEDGYFRLNGRRIFLRSSHTGNCCPIGLELPHDPDILRRDLLNVKVMGFNAIRFIAGMPKRFQLDLCDEIGLLVYEESYAGWCLADSPRMAERFDRSTREMILRDRNHPSVVVWGLLNETPDGPVFRHAVEALKLVRSLDDSRLVLLGSGRWDGQLEIGSVCNPGSQEWETLMGDEGPGQGTSALSWGGYVPRAGDIHVYPRVPHTAETIHFLRTVGEGTKNLFLSEYGIGSAVDLWRAMRHYERLGAESADDAVFYRDKLDKFLADWERWKLEEMFGDPQDYFAACLRKMAGQRLLGLNAIRSNPKLVGYSLTGTVDQGMTGEGLFTTFRELKPGTTDAMFDGLAPLRLCCFAEPPVSYVGDRVRLEVVLANEDALAPGEYPLRVQVVGPDGVRQLDEGVSVTIPPRGDSEPPFAQPVFDGELAVAGPPGRCRLLATFQRGAAATGGEAVFHTLSREDMPSVQGEVVLWGADPDLHGWLQSAGIAVRPLSATEPPPGEMILIGSVPAPQGAQAFSELHQRVTRGATAIFLCAEVFREGDDPTAYLFLEEKPTLQTMAGWLYLKDEWAKQHPVFEGLPAGDLMDYGIYRDIIPDQAWSGGPMPQEAIAGAIKTSQDYCSGLMLAAYQLGAGRVILNTLRIRENLGINPVAERLLRNLLRWAG